MKQWNRAAEAYFARHPRLSFAADLLRVFLDRRVSRSAAELSYYLILTLFPLLLVVTVIVGWLPIEIGDVIETLSEVMPPDSLNLVVDYLSYVQAYRSWGMLTAGVVTIITAASAAFRALMTISGEIYGRRAFRGVWYFLSSVLFSVLLLVMVYLSMVVVLTGGWFIRLLRRIFAYLPIPLSVPVHWTQVRLLLLFAVALLFLSLLYRVTAPREEERPPVMLGASLTALTLTVFSLLFSALISYSSKYSLVYGSLSAVIILMVWLYFCCNIVVLGNVFNYVLWQHRRGLPVELDSAV